DPPEPPVSCSAACPRPRCTPRWYAERRPRTASGERRWVTDLLGARSTPPGTSCAIGRRLGSPAEVTSVGRASAAIEAARQPSSAAVRHSSCHPLSCTVPPPDGPAALDR